MYEFDAPALQEVHGTSKLLVSVRAGISAAAVRGKGPLMAALWAQARTIRPYTSQLAAAAAPKLGPWGR